MKHLLVLLALAGVALASQEISTRKQLTVNGAIVQKLVDRIITVKEQRLDLEINDVVDEIFDELSTLIIQEGLDPIQMPEIHLNFEYKPLLITYHGELDMTGGWLQDISSMHREGNASISMNNDFVIIKIPIAFNDLIASYLYSAKLMDLGPTGSVYGRIYDVTCNVDILIDMLNLEAMLMDFHLEAGTLDLHFYGNGLVDWFVNLLIDVAEALFHNTIIQEAGEVIVSIISALIEAINDYLGDILGVQFKQVDFIRL